MSRRQAFRIALMVGVMVFGSVALAFALNELTHELVNRQAAKLSSLDTTLKNELGLTAGLREIFNGTSVLRWLELGGKYEDSSFCRPARHFHDPLRPWAAAGLRTRNPLIGVACLGLSFPSSLYWAQEPNQGLGGSWSWQDARRYYLTALTAPTTMEREQAWADTLRALGQLMHLVVDASVPEHVRNDPHVMEAILRQIGLRGYGSYEYWASDQHGGSGSATEGNFIAMYLSNPIGFDLSILQEPTGDPLAPVPVGRLIDTDLYTGADPNVTLQPAIGIAEVANANFFSEDTTEPGAYPFPDVSRLQLSLHPAPKTGRVRAYYAKGVGDGLPADPVLAECVLDEAAKAEGVFDTTTYRCVDENVWTQTAQAMLPRAVGYAQGLLDYFFRGSLAVWQAYWDDGKVVLDLSNEGDESMEGVFEVYAIHDKGSAGERRVKFASLEGGAVTTLPVGSSRTFQVDVPSGHGLTRHHILVFRGRLGEEADAVVGHLFLLIPRVLFVQQDSRADIKLERCDRYVWPDPGIQSPDGSLAEERLSCLWTPVNRQISGRLVKNVVDPVIKRIVVRTGFSAAGTRSATIWERQGAEPDPVAITFAAADSPFFWEQGVLFLDIQLTDGPTISTKLATLDVGLSGHTKVIVYEDVGRNKTYAVISTKSAYLAISSDRNRDKTISISGYANPTNTLTEQRHGSLAASEGVVVNSAVYQEVVIAAFEIYPGGWIEPPKFDPDYAEPQRAFDAVELVDPQIEGGPRTKWESVIERVYYRWEAEFLRAFMPGVPPRFTIQLSGTQQ